MTSEDFEYINQMDYFLNYIWISIFAQNFLLFKEGILW